MRPPKRVGPTALVAGNATLYTATQPTRLTHLGLTNPTAAPIAVTIAVVPVGVVLATVHHVLSAQNVPPNDVFEWEGEIPMLAGDTIQGSGNGLNMRGTVQEEF